MREPEPLPFWTYRDVAMFIGLAPLCFLIGSLVVKAALWVGSVDKAPKVWGLPAQFLGYMLLFTALARLFQWQYGRALWPSLRGMPSNMRMTRAVLLGCAQALSIALLGALLKTPNIDSPMKELLSGRWSLIALAAVGTTVGPLFEELAFRGFLQPLLVRTVGVAAGIGGAAVCFGLMHLPQYGLSWRHGLLISLAGAGFGIMRHVSQSTIAAIVMHGAYNFTLFLGFISAGGKDVPNTW